MAKHNIMVRATSLSGVAGRVDYISNPKRQEHLEAVYTTADRNYWKELSKHCQEQAKYSHTKKAVEGREWMIPLANDLVKKMEPAELARLISEEIKKETGAENVVAIHWNKTKKNYHAHVVSSENEEISKIKEGAVLTRNTYYDAAGKRSSKKECVDQDGNLKPGCTLLKKGERKVEEVRFGPKIDKLGSKAFLQDLKLHMANFQNELLQEDRFRVFDGTLYIAEQHIGPRDKQNKMPDDIVEAIEAKNQLVRAYNNAVDDCLNLASMMGWQKHELQSMKNARKDVKKHARTGRWEKAIAWHTERLLERSQWLREQFMQQTPAEPQKEAVEASERKVSLSDRIASANALRGEQSHNATWTEKQAAWAAYKAAKDDFWSNYAIRRQELKEAVNDAYRRRREIENAEWVLENQNTLIGAIVATIYLMATVEQRAMAEAEITRLRWEQEKLRQDIANFKAETSEAAGTLRQKNLSLDAYMTSIKRMQDIADQINWNDLLNANTNEHEHVQQRNHRER